MGYILSNRYVSKVSALLDEGSSSELCTGNDVLSDVQLDDRSAVAMVHTCAGHCVLDKGSMRKLGGSFLPIGTPIQGTRATLYFRI